MKSVAPGIRYRLMLKVYGVNTDDLTSIIDAVEFRRTQYGMSKADMAAVLGMERSHYTEFVNGRRELPKSAMRAAYIIGVPPDCLFQASVERGR